MNLKQIIGKTKEQVLELLGNNYTTEFGGDVWVYTIKTWYRREKILMIEFEYDNTVINVDKSWI